MTGARVQATLTAGERVEGELLALGMVTLWILRSGVVLATPLPAIRAVRVPRHDMDTRKAMKWAAIAGVGSGLGLTFCKLAVEAHGGHIWVDRGKEGGAAFHFSLPM